MNSCVGPSPRATHLSLSQPNFVTLDLNSLQKKIECLSSTSDSLCLSYLLKCCGELKAYFQGKQLHAIIHNRGWLDQKVLCHGLISMYGKCGNLKDAQIVFSDIKDKNVVSWNSIIGIYIQNGKHEEALRHFDSMKAQGISPNRITFMTVLSACNSHETLNEGKRIHAYAVDSGLDKDLAIKTALVNMYSKCGDLCVARSLFDEMAVRDVVSWNGLITAYVQHGHIIDALHVYQCMLTAHVQPNSVTFIIILNACVCKDTLIDCRVIHGSIIETGIEDRVTIGNALTNSYGKCASLLEARHVFDKMPRHDVISWNTLILVSAQNGFRKEALRIFQQMQSSGVRPTEVTYITVLSLCASPLHLDEGEFIHSSAKKHKLDSNTLVGNSLLLMYSNCGNVGAAAQMFEKIEERNMITWNAIISVCDKHGLALEAQRHFLQMLREGVTPNEYTLASVLSSSTSLGALEEGKVMHTLAVENNFDTDIVIVNALVNLYGRSGSLEDAFMLFKKMQKRSVVTWTAMLASYAQHGNGQEALRIFQQMCNEGLDPNEISFVSVLSACSHSGLVHEGCYYLSSMPQNFDVTPIAIHYSCVMDLFGRIGSLDLASYVMDQMPFQPDSDEWYTLLCACKSRGDVWKGMSSAKQVLELHPQHSAAYVSLSNIYASAGMCDISLY